MRDESMPKGVRALVACLLLSAARCAAPSVAAADGSIGGNGGSDLSASAPDLVSAGGADLSSSSDGAMAATALYAAPNGSGSACTLAQPCSLSGAQALVRTLNQNMAGDIVVNLLDGTYRLTSPLALGPADSGNNGYRVIYQASAGAYPVFSGGLAITGFAVFNQGMNIWRAAVPHSSNGRQLYVNGVRAERPHTARGAIAFTPTTRGLATVAADNLIAAWMARPGLEVAYDNSWKHLRCPVASIEKTVVTTPIAGYPAPSAMGTTLVVDSACWTNNMIAVPNLGYPFNGAGLPRLDNVSTVENVLELLTSPGQFYLDTTNSFVYYIPRNGEDLSTAAVELATAQTLVSISGTPGHLAALNDSDASISYGANWFVSTARGNGDLNDDVHAIGMATTAATITFTGTGIDLLGETNTDGAAFDVSIQKMSGGPAMTGSGSETGTVRLAQQVIYSVSGLAKDTYQLTLQKHAADANWLTLDAVVVTPETIAPVHDISLRGITFAVATWTLPSTSGYIDNQAGVLWDAVTHMPTRIPGAVSLQRAMRIELSGNSFVHLGGAGVDLGDGTQDSTVVGNRFDDISGGAVSVGEVDDFYLNDQMASGPKRMTSGISLTNNAITNVGIDYHDICAVWVGDSRTTTIANNLIAHTSYSGISLGWGWGWTEDCASQMASGSPSCRRGTNYSGANHIIHNRIYDVMRTLYDGGPIYTNGGQNIVNGEAPTVSGNVVSNSIACTDMLYHDEGSSNWRTDGNVSYNTVCRWLGMWAKTIHDNLIGTISPNYTDNPTAAQNGGTNNTVSAPILMANGGAWPPAVQSVIDQSGLQMPYRGLAGTTTLLNDNDAVARYSNNGSGPDWAAQDFRGVGDLDDDVHYTGNNGAQVQLSFNGTGVAVLGEKNSDQGMLSVSLDGGPASMVDTSVAIGAPRLVRQVIYEIHGLPAGAHTVVLTKLTGGYATIDGFRLDQPVTPFRHR